MPIGTEFKMSTTNILKKCAKMRRNLGRLVIPSIFLALGLVPVLFSTPPVSAAGSGDSLPLIEIHTGAAPRVDALDLLPGVISDGVSPHTAPYGIVQDGEFGIALQLTPLAASREIRWETTSEAPVVSTFDNTRPHVWVKIEPKPGNRSFFLAFVIALFTISATGVMLMWRQIAKPDASERPGWERWRH